VGLLALLVPQVLGVGYGYVGDALNGKMVLELMAVLVVFKTLAVVIGYASGNAGGIFGPSLFIGAMLGGCVGTLAHRFLPAYTATAGAYALVGMGTAFAGIVRAPMTSVIMIFETTRDYAVIVPLMISNLLSFLVSRKLQRQPIYEVLALQDGIHLPGRETEVRLRERRVAQFMRPATETLSAQLSLPDALQQVSQSPFHCWPVMEDGELLGVVLRSGLERAVAEGSGTRPIGQIAGSFQFAHIHKDQPIHVALERMGAAGLDLLPVVSRANTRLLEGIITRQDILDAYGIGSLSQKE